MKKAFVATILFGLGCFACAEEVDNSKMRGAVRRVISFADANCVIESEIASDETGGFKQLDSILNTYKLGKNVFYLGKGNQDGQDCSQDDATCVDLFAVDMSYSCSAGNGALVSGLFLSSSWVGSQIDFRPNIRFEKTLDAAWDYGHTEIKQTKKAPNPEFLVTTLEHDEQEDSRFPTLRYEQKFRFNPKTLKMQAIDKKKFLGKEE